jgi:hypothetical protein
MFRIISVGLATACLFTTANAEPIQTVHQSRLVDASGAPIEGAHTVRIALWDLSSGGVEQWGETFFVTLQDGYFSATLGADTVTNPLDSGLFDDSPMHVEVTVDSVVMGDRTALTTVPYAVHAQSVAQGVPVGTILPFGGDAASLDDSWMVCDGATVTSPGIGLVDFNSSAGGVQVPNLTDSRFLMGVSSSSVGSTGGRNDIPSDGSHTHTFGQTASDLAPDASNVSNGSYTNPSGAHTHGGENRPKFVGVQYIIRVR